MLDRKQLGVKYFVTNVIFSQKVLLDKSFFFEGLSYLIELKLASIVYLLIYFRLKLNLERTLGNCHFSAFIKYVTIIDDLPVRIEAAYSDLSFAPCKF